MTDFPKIELEGGPMGRDLTLKVDGEKVDKVTGVTIYADVNDVVRVETRQIATVANMHVYGAFDKNAVVKATIHLHMPDEGGEDHRIAFEGQGKTLREAVLGAVENAESRLDIA